VPILGSQPYRSERPGKWPAMNDHKGSTPAVRVSPVERRLLALTGGARCPRAFPLLKADRQCCSGGTSSQVDPFRTLVVSVSMLEQAYTTMLCGAHTPRLYGLATPCRLRGLFPRTSERRTAPESGLTGPPSAMQRRHRDDSRWAFPLAAPHSDIAPEEALASRSKKAELYVEKEAASAVTRPAAPSARVRQVRIAGR
jgi:hypothetical protein